MSALPLLRRDGTVRAHALLDVDDLHRATALGRWYVDSHGYVVCRNHAGGGKTYLHRLVLGLQRGDGLEGDHRNGDKLDNRRANLRISTHAQNGQNQTRGGRGSSQHRGVSWDGRARRWHAYARLNYRQYHLGYFDTEDEAAEAARAFRAEHMPHSTT